MAPPFELRPAQAGDEAVILAFVRRARLNRFGLHWTNFTVAIDGDSTVIGCIQIKSHGPGVRELASLVVADAWRRQGVARALVASVKAEAGTPLWLMCAGRLAPFYEPFGFRRIRDPKQLPRYFRRINRLFTLFRRLVPPQFELAIMLWDD